MQASDVILPAMFAACAGLFAFALLTLWGLRIVAWLGLSRDLPMELKVFEAPAPPLTEAGDRAAAATRAARQHVIAAGLADARIVCARQAESADLKSEATALVAALPPEQQSAAQVHLATIIASADRLKARWTEVEPLIAPFTADADPDRGARLAAARADAEAAWTDLAKACAALPDPGRTRRLMLWAVLIAAAVVAVALLVFLQPGVAPGAGAAP